MIALVDHGVGNLRSVEKALETMGAKVQLCSNPEEILKADKIVLPGVGAFADAMEGLRARSLVNAVVQTIKGGRPLLGICVGMQMLFEISHEHGSHPGLGLLPGEVRMFDSSQLKIPQTGWNQIHHTCDSPLLYGLETDCYAFFNHSFFCSPSYPTDILATTNYGFSYASVVGRGNLYGVQFHPEKSQQVGLRILKNFITIC